MDFYSSDVKIFGVPS